MNFADSILYNGKIITMDKNKNIVDAIAIKNGKIIGAGNEEDIFFFKGKNTDLINLDNKVALPGFIDSHVHFIQTGLNTMAVKLNETKNISEILDLLKHKYDTDKNEEVIRGIGYDETELIERRPPNINELDNIVPDKPVFLERVDIHSMTVNSKAFELIDLPLETEGIDLDEDNKPTGTLRSSANSIARGKLCNLISEETKILAMEKASQKSVKSGVTTVNALEGGDLFSDKEPLIILNNKETMPIHIELFYQTTDVDKVLSLGLRRIGGCIILDGSFGSRTAALLESYTDDPNNNGVLYYTQEEVNNFVEKSHREGLQITVHTLGDRAIEQILTAYKLAMKKYPKKDCRHRIEHIELPTKKHLELASELGVILSVQPAFEYYWGGTEGMYGVRLGIERTLRTNPYKTALDKGCLLIGGSDSDVTPINPLLGIHGALNHSNKTERVDIYEAIAMFTINGAKGIFLEDKKGSIEIGKDADIAVLSEDILNIDTEYIKDIEVEMTIKSGKIIYKK